MRPRDDLIRAESTNPFGCAGSVVRLHQEIEILLDDTGLDDLVETGGADFTPIGVDVKRMLEALVERLDDGEEA